MALLSISKKDVYACLTNFNHLYHIVFQCDMNCFYSQLPENSNFFLKMSILCL